MELGKGDENQSRCFFKPFLKVLKIPNYPREKAPIPEAITFLGGPFFFFCIPLPLDHKNRRPLQSGKEVNPLKWFFFSLKKKEIKSKTK